MRRSLLFKIHSIVGLIAGIFILLLSFSGSLLVFHEELDGLQQPKPVEVPGAPLLGVDSAYRIIQAHYPAAMISNCRLPQNHDQLFSFNLYDPGYKNGKEAMQVFLHPQTGGQLSVRGGSDDTRHNFMSWLSRFHNSFHLGKTGEWLLGVFAVLFAVSILTGLFLYRKNIIAALLFKKRLLNKGSLHQLVGSWALIFNLMIAITGFWMQRYVFKPSFYTDQSRESTIRPSAPLTFSIDNALANARQHFPRFTPYVIYFPFSSGGSTTVYGSNSFNAFIHSKDFADAVSFDSAGNTGKTRFIGNIPAQDRYDIANSQLHFGKYGGLPVKILYSFFGLSGAILSITGFFMWRRRHPRGSSA